MPGALQSVMTAATVLVAVSSVTAFMPAAAPLRGLVRMSGSMEGSSSRREVMGGVGAGLAALVLSTNLNLQPALADSTGKYSTKLSAKRRYLPRIKRGLVAFEDLAKTLKTDKAVSGAESFASLLESDLKNALLLYGASTKMGELPDPKSRSLEKEVEDFVKAVNYLPSAAAKGEGPAVYAEASKVLNAFLAGAKLPPLGSPDYRAADK